MDESNDFEEENVRLRLKQKNKLDHIRHKAFKLNYDIYIDDKSLSFIIKIVWYSNGAKSGNNKPKIDRFNTVAAIDMKKTRIITNCNGCFEIPCYKCKRFPHHIPDICSHDRNILYKFSFRTGITEQTKPEALKILNEAYACMEKAIDEYYKQREEKKDK